MAKRVLIVDDAAFMRAMLKKILTQNGFVVVGEASNGHEAFDRYMELKPDLVTMDITMPQCDGIEAVKMIRTYDKGANIIMCSAMGQQTMVLEAIKSGAKDFIVKPFNEVKIVDAINKIFPDRR